MRKLVKNFVPMMITCLLAGLVLAILAPYGTQDFAPVYRFVYWTGLCVAGGFGVGLTDAVTFWRGWSLKPWQHAALQSVTATLAVATIVLIMTINSFGMPSIKNFFLTLFYVWMISIILTSIGVLLKSRAATGTAPKRALIIERLAPRLRAANIYALAAEDHYVRVITSRGDELILMRLSDAIRETAPLKGLSPHRSWWVAEAGVGKINKSEILLRSGQTVPISRTGMKLVREAGWV